MKTPLNELKQEILDLRYQAHVNGLDEFKNALNQVINRIDSKIEQEKKVIMDACIYGAENEYGFGQKQALEYYDETFKSEEILKEIEESPKTELQARIDALKELAKKSPPAPSDLSPVETSLSKVIRNQKEADDFMRQLRSLTPDFWNGWIEDFDEDKICCILRKDYNLDKELEMDRDALTQEQNAMVKSGLCLRFDIINKKIQFMRLDGSWL